MTAPAPRTDLDIRDPESLNRVQLAAHFSVDRGTLGTILLASGLTPFAGRFAWAAILRRIHGIDRHVLPGLLANARADHRPGGMLAEIDDLARELRRPLMRFEEMSQAIGFAPNTLSRALRDGRARLPFPTIAFGPRLRRYRPVEVELWRDAGIDLGLPAPFGMPADRGAEPAVRAPAPAGQALFPAIAPDKRKSGGELE